MDWLQVCIEPQVVPLVLFVASCWLRKRHKWPRNLVSFCVLETNKFVCHIVRFDGM